MNKKGIKFEEKENTSLKDDVKEMKNIIKIKGIKLTEDISSKEYEIGKMKKDQNKGILIFDANEIKIKNYSYYVKKILESKTNRESNKYIKKLIFNHLKLE